MASAKLTLTVDTPFPVFGRQFEHLSYVGWRVWTFLPENGRYFHHKSSHTTGGCHRNVSSPRELLHFRCRYVKLCSWYPFSDTFNQQPAQLLLFFWSLVPRLRSRYGIRSSLSVIVFATKRWSEAMLRYTIDTLSTCLVLFSTCMSYTFRSNDWALGFRHPFSKALWLGWRIPSSNHLLGIHRRPLWRHVPRNVRACVQPRLPRQLLPWWSLRVDRYSAGPVQDRRVLPKRYDYRGKCMERAGGQHLTVSISLCGEIISFALHQDGKLISGKLISESDTISYCDAQNSSCELLQALLSYIFKMYRKNVNKGVAPLC